MHIRILDRYIFREVLATFLFSICAFSAVFVGSGTLFQIAKYVTDYGASMSAVAKIFVLSLPGVAMWTFPMSMLLASLLTIGRLSGASEITAMKSCGIGFGRIAAPVVLLGAIVSGVALWFNQQVVPWANTAYQNVVYYEIRGGSGMKSQEHVVFKEMENGNIKRLVYARRYDGNTQTMQGLTMQEFGANGGIVRVENAKTAKWSGKDWTMHNGMIYDLSSDGNEHNMRFDTQVLPIATNPQQIIREQKEPEAMSMQELRVQIAIMKTQYVDTSKLETELYQRWSVPLASLIFTLVGVPLGMQPNRSSSSAGFAMSLIIIFLYYSLMTLGNAMARGAILPAMVAVWIPNILGMITGAILIWHASR